MYRPDGVDSAPAPRPRGMVHIAVCCIRVWDPDETGWTCAAGAGAPRNNPTQIFVDTRWYACLLKLPSVHPFLSLGTWPAARVYTKDQWVTPVWCKGGPHKPCVCDARPRCDPQKRPFGLFLAISGDKKSVNSSFLGFPANRLNLSKYTYETSPLL